MVVSLSFCQRVFVNATRRIGYPLRLAWNRLVHGAGRAGLLALGIAAAAAALAAVIGGSLVAQDEALARALERVPPNERSVSVVYSDLGVTRNGVTREDLEPLVDRTLEGLVPGDPVRAVQLKLLRIGGQLVNVGATDDLGRFVRLTSGRLPETCTPERCEVIQLGGSGRVPSVEGLRFVKVGEGTLVSPLPFGRLPGANATRLGDSFGIAEPPFLVAEGFDEFSTLPGLDGFYRTYAWTSPLAARRRASVGDRRVRRGLAPARARRCGRNRSSSISPRRSTSSPPHGKPARSPGSGCCSWAARPRRSCSRSRSWPPPECGATSRVSGSG